jgi:hypothetical protein
MKKELEYALKVKRSVIIINVATGKAGKENQS